MAAHDEAFMGATIEVTVQSLHGIVVNSDIPKGMTAAVTFTGSCENMQVGSSTLCGLTGQLLIESAPLQCSDDPLPGTASQRVTAHWPENQSESKGRPHLTVHLPTKNPALPKAPLSMSNRGSEIVKKLCSQDENDSMSTVSTSPSSSGPSSSDPPFVPPTPRSASAIWSNSGDAMPEIVELTVRLKSSSSSASSSQSSSLSDEQQQHHEGMAYLVMFGHENDHGTYIMDLPVRKIGADHLQPDNDIDFYLSSEARLRIKLEVVRRGDDKTLVPSFAMIPTATTTASTDDERIGRSVRISTTSPELEKQMVGQQKKWRGFDSADVNDNNVVRVKEPMEVHVPEVLPYDDDYTDEDATSFCSGLWNWETVFQTLANVVRCDSSAAAPIPRHSAYSVGSTIATRESMDW
jgi:hypothetical protein